MVGGDNDAAPRAGCLHVPDPPSPAALAALLSAASAGLHADVSLTWAFRADACAFDATLASRTGARRAPARCGTRVFSEALGLGFAGRALASLGRGATTHREAASPCAALWTRASVAPGWYGPSHRPMCSGAPLRFSAEPRWRSTGSSAPVPERVVEGAMTAHLV